MICQQECAKPQWLCLRWLRANRVDGVVIGGVAVSLLAGHSDGPH